MMSHESNHAAFSSGCQVNGVQALGFCGAVLLEPAKNVCNHFTRIWHEQFLHTLQFECARHLAFVAKGADGEYPNGAISKFFAFQAVHGDKPLTFSLCAAVGHHEILPDICDSNGWKRGFTYFNFHSEFTLSGWGTDMVKLAGGYVNRASRHARTAKKGIAA